MGKQTKRNIGQRAKEINEGKIFIRNELLEMRGEPRENKRTEFKERSLQGVFSL